MLLIIGSEGSGKRTFARSLGYADSDMADAVLDDCPIIYHLEQMVFDDPDCVDVLLERLEGKQVILCNEVGCGVIPAERKERLGREATGRLSVKLAQKADCVVRMVSGLPMVIKGDLACR